TATKISRWRNRPAPRLATGNPGCTVSAVDDAGKASPVSDSVNFVVEPPPPLTPVITSVSDDQAPGLGTIANGQNTNEPTPTFRGTADAGPTTTLHENGTALGTPPAQPDRAGTAPTPTPPSDPRCPPVP
ncbi:hypothetical protein, partial [Salmonella enterica]|uniref:hypothetical protein n=1 Tax=Salmonella enterica TaxID=28901 RepID=UPI00398C4554